MLRGAHSSDAPSSTFSAVSSLQDQARALGRQSGGGDGVEGGAARQRAKAVPAVMRAHFMLSYEVRSCLRKKSAISMGLDGQQGVWQPSPYLVGRIDDSCLDPAPPSRPLHNIAMCDVEH